MLPVGCAPPDPPAAARIALRRVESAIICVFGPSFFKYSLPMSKRAKRTVFGQIPDSGVFGRGLRLALRCIASRRIVLQCDALRCVAFCALLLLLLVLQLQLVLQLLLLLQLVSAHC